MAVPRVFISSTYYDLKQVRSNIWDFIKNLGYEPVMHEKADVAYTQTTTLENDCYHEIASCDIVVCIIGNHFGSKSSENELSITMNEIRTAIKHKKKVYIFIAKDVYIENKTYEQNKETGSFKSAYADDIKIHEFISELKNNVKHHMIESFETTEEITRTLSKQFAGLFQNLLQKDASATEAKTAYDLQESADNIKSIIEEFQKEKEEFFNRFEGTPLKLNGVIHYLRELLNLKHCAFFIKDVKALDEFMKCIGFKSVDVDDPLEDHRKYSSTNNGIIETFVFKDEVFEESGKIKDIRSREQLKQYVLHELEVSEDDDNDLPF